MDRLLATVLEYIFAGLTSQEAGALAQYFRRLPLCATEPLQCYRRYGGPKRPANVVLSALALLGTNAAVVDVNMGASPPIALPAMPPSTAP